MLLRDIPEQVLKKIRKHAIADYEKGIEGCGLICTDPTSEDWFNANEVIHAKNEAEDPANFYKIDGQSLCRRNVTAIWHSHINGKDEFSPADIETIRKGTQPHILYDVQNDRWRVADPSPTAEFIGTQFTYGVHDCYSIVRAWYRHNQDIELGDYGRSTYKNDDGTYCWQAEGWDLFRENFLKEGAIELAPRGILQMGDVLLMCLHGCNPNHMAVITDPEKEIMLHQQVTKLSCHEQWDGYWRENTISILRRA
jgi:proteasome lid subunit RPN8/RPN11